MTKYAFLESGVDREMQKKAALSWRPWRWGKDSAETGNEYNWSDLWKGIGGGAAITGNQLMHSAANAGLNIGSGAAWLVGQGDRTADWFNRRQKDIDDYYDSGDIGRATKDLRDENEVFRTASRGAELLAEGLATAPLGNFASKAVKGLSVPLVKEAPRFVRPFVNGAVRTANSAIKAAPYVAAQGVPLMAGTPTTRTDDEQMLTRGNINFSRFADRMHWGDHDKAGARLYDYFDRHTPETGETYNELYRDIWGRPHTISAPDGRPYRYDPESGTVFTSDDRSYPLFPLHLTEPTTLAQRRALATLAADSESREQGASSDVLHRLAGAQQADYTAYPRLGNGLYAIPGGAVDDNGAPIGTRYGVGVHPTYQENGMIPTRSSYDFLGGDSKTGRDVFNVLGHLANMYTYATPAGPYLAYDNAIDNAAHGNYGGAALDALGGMFMNGTARAPYRTGSGKMTTSALSSPVTRENAKAFMTPGSFLPNNGWRSGVGNIAADVVSSLPSISSDFNPVYSDTASEYAELADAAGNDKAPVGAFSRPIKPGEPFVQLVPQEL